MNLIDRLFINIIAILITISAGCVLSLIYQYQTETTPTYYTINQEGNKLWLTPIN